MSTALLVMWMWLHGQTQTVNGHAVLPGCRIEHIVTAEGTSINTQLCGDGNGETHQVDPVDVPAVQEPMESICGYGPVGRDTFNWICSNNGHPPKGAAEDRVVAGEGGWRWTCTEKSRFLLPAEDGTKHCLKFGGR